MPSYIIMNEYSCPIGKRHHFIFSATQTDYW